MKINLFTMDRKTAAVNPAPVPLTSCKRKWYKRNTINNHSFKGNRSIEPFKCA